LLIRVDERTLHLEKQMDNHLRHHMRRDLALLIVALTTAGTALVAVLSAVYS